VIATVVVLAATLGVGRGDASIRNVLTFGMGQQSCASWPETATSERDGENWVMGYWSGLNRFSSRNGLVGVRAGGEDIIAEVKKVCADHPSTNLNDATLVVYSAMEAAGR
jgi:trans-2-enoyl-CoA reductase